MQETMKNDVRHVIEEIHCAFQGFSEHHTMNGDYAEFASMAIGQFRDALQNPALTREELKHMLRRGITKHRDKQPEKKWSKFVAGYVTKSSNTNMA